MRHSKPGKLPHHSKALNFEVSYVDYAGLGRRNTLLPGEVSLTFSQCKGRSQQRS